MRKSFLIPIPELNLAAKLLDVAVDSLMLGKEKLAASQIAAADFPEIMDYTIQIVGPLSEQVHRQTKLPKVLPKSERNFTRMPPAKIQEEIFNRDGWRCRFCGVKVISRKARKLLLEEFKIETHWSNKEFERHSALYSLAVSLDHVVPHSRGGSNKIENFVTACYCCQFGRGQWTLEESEILDPRDSTPVIDSWDGLSRLHAWKAGM